MLTQHFRKGSANGIINFSVLNDFVLNSHRDPVAPNVRVLPRRMRSELEPWVNNALLGRDIRLSDFPIGIVLAH